MILDDWNADIKLAGGVRKPEPSNHPDPRVNLTLADMKLEEVVDRPTESVNAGELPMFLGGRTIEEDEANQGGRGLE